MVSYTEKALIHYQANYYTYGLLFSDKNLLLHPPLLKHILFNGKNVLAIEIPITYSKYNISGHIDLILFSNGIIYISDYKPNLNNYNKFRYIPQLCAYAFIIMKILNLTINHVKCIIFSEKNSWEFSPSLLTEKINPFIQGLKNKNSDINFNWKDVFFFDIL